jgi:hypothetical protein
LPDLPFGIKSIIKCEKLLKNLLYNKYFCYNEVTRELMDRVKISCIVLEEKCGSDIEDFSEARYFLHTCEEKSSRDESIFPSKTVQVVFIRSLKWRL